MRISPQRRTNNQNELRSLTPKNTTSSEGLMRLENEVLRLYAMLHQMKQEESSIV